MYATPVLDTLCLKLVLEYVDPSCLFTTLPLVCQDWYEYLDFDNSALWDQLYKNEFGDKLIGVDNIKQLFVNRYRNVNRYERQMNKLRDNILKIYLTRLSLLTSNAKFEHADEIQANCVEHTSKFKRLDDDYQYIRSFNDLYERITNSIALLFSADEYNWKPYYRFIQSKHAFILEDYDVNINGDSEERRFTTSTIHLFGVNGDSVQFELSTDTIEIEENYLDRCKLQLDVKFGDNADTQLMMKINYDGELAEIKQLEFDFEQLDKIQFLLMNEASGTPQAKYLLLVFLFTILSGIIEHGSCNNFITQVLLPKLKTTIDNMKQQKKLTYHYDSESEDEQDNDDDLGDFLEQDEQYNTIHNDQSYEISSDEENEDDEVFHDLEAQDEDDENDQNERVIIFDVDDNEAIVGSDRNRSVEFDSDEEPAGEVIYDDDEEDDIIYLDEKKENNKRKRKQQDLKAEKRRKVTTITDDDDNNDNEQVETLEPMEENHGENGDDKQQEQQSDSNESIPSNDSFVDPRPIEEIEREIAELKHKLQKVRSKTKQE
jgi:hypothetical protein